MTEVQITITNQMGLHARPASEFSKTSAGFQSKITVKKADEDAKPVNAKSITRILALSVCKGDRIVLCADGEDEQQAVEALVALAANNFGEEQ